MGYEGKNKHGRFDESMFGRMDSMMEQKTGASIEAMGEMICRHFPNTPRERALRHAKNHVRDIRKRDKEPLYEKKGRYSFHPF